MSLDKVRLPASVITSLYRNSLVLGDREKLPKDAAPPPEVSEPKQVLRYLGNNAKKVILIVESREASFLEDRHLSFLTRILEACKMNLGDVAIVNLVTCPVTMEVISRELAPRTVLLFGLEPTAIKLPFLIPPFKIQEFDNRRFLCAPGLNELNQDTEEGKMLKTKLWACLRILFDV